MQPVAPPVADPDAFTAAGVVGLPGRGLSLAWSPDGQSIAAGGHFRDKVTRQRYDTRTIDVAALRLAKSFNCHYWWTVAHAWSDNPHLGNVVVDGGGDHAVKIWDADGRGSAKCSSPGQFRADEGAVRGLYNINGWTTSLAFSPDGDYLAGTSRDRTVRIWQLAPGPDQFKVVKLWYDKNAGTYLSVRWSPDGRRLLVGDREGRVAEWTFDPVADRWDDETITAFARMSWEDHPTWFGKNRALLAPVPLWIDGGHKEVWNARYSPDGTRVAAAGADGTVSVFASVTGVVQYRAQAPKVTPFHGLDWSPDGALLAAGAADKNVYLFDATDGSIAQTLTGHGTIVSAVAWSPDGSTLASTAGGPLLSLALNEVSDGPDDNVRFWRRP
jgi:WD40 repeat protein